MAIDSEIIYQDDGPGDCAGGAVSAASVAVSSQQVTTPFKSIKALAFDAYGTLWFRSDAFFAFL